MNVKNNHLKITFRFIDLFYQILTDSYMQKKKNLLDVLVSIELCHFRASICGCQRKEREDVL